MGSSTWSKDAYADVRNTRSTMAFTDNFTQQAKRVAHEDLKPKDVVVRESRDSSAHPNSLAVIFGLDVTGSMGSIPENLIKTKLGTLMATIIDNGILDPQILFAAVGDHISDKFPLQISQFESGTAELDDQLSKIYIEQGGGAQAMESYPLVWLFGARQTSIDCFEKRGEKGFLFTCGDEGFHPVMTKELLKEKIGYVGQEDLTAEQLYEEVCRTYHVFHIHVMQASNGRNQSSIDQWKRLIGQNLLMLDDQDKVAEVVATTIALVHGIDIDKAMADFDAKTRSSVSTALATVKDSLVKTGKTETGVVAI